MNDIKLTFDCPDCNEEVALLCLQQLTFTRSKNNGIDVAKCKSVKVKKPPNISANAIKSAWKGVKRAILIENQPENTAVISGSVILDEGLSKSLWTFQINIVNQRFTLKIIEEPIDKVARIGPKSIRGPASAVGSKDEVNPITD